MKGYEKLTVSTHDNLYTSLASQGIILEASCAGNGTCGKCKVSILEGELVDKNGEPARPTKDGSFLACQVYPSSHLTIDKISHMEVSSKGKVSEINIAKKDLTQGVKKVVVKPEYPVLKNNYSLQEMIKKASSGKRPLQPQVLRQLAEIALNKPPQLTLVLVNDEITFIEEGDTGSIFYGIAFDIGTTTVAGMLMNLSNGKMEAAASASNPQMSFGADVISRIKYAGKPEGLQLLSLLIRKTLNNIILQLCEKVSIPPESIYLVTAAGNSTMEHLLMEVNPKSLAVSPYVSTFNFLPSIAGKEINLDINPGGSVQLLPNITSFVGADMVAGIAAVDQDLTEKLTLLIDLGTNGEIALGNRDRLLVSSTAAGPAFEGAQLSCGMRAVEGAIDSVRIYNGDLTFTTINDGRPRGICGSGIIMAVAELYKVGIISEGGRLVDDPDAVEFPNLIEERLKVVNGEKEFVLAFAEESEDDPEVKITQHDIREIQLVKSSIYTGVQILANNFGIPVEDIEQILIAGAFGNYVDITSALDIGLLPGNKREIVRSVGNAAGEGSAKALLSKAILDRCFRIAEKAEFIELANDPGFQEKFIKNLSFPAKVT